MTSKKNEEFPIIDKDDTEEEHLQNETKNTKTETEEDNLDLYFPYFDVF